MRSLAGSVVYAPALGVGALRGVHDESIEQALAEGKPAKLRDAIEPLEALDAFGAAGTYNRAALARLYGGTRVRVARRWQQRDDQFVSETLLSPYPDPTLTRLNPGTMVIRFTLAHVERKGPAFAR